MSRFFRTLGTAIAIMAAAGTISSLGQPVPKASAPEAAPPVAPFWPMGPIFAPHLPPPPMMALAEAGRPPLPLPPMPGTQYPPAAEICLDNMARRSALWAYLKSRLNLTSQQLSAWQDFENAATESEAEERQACSKLAAKPGDQTIVQRLDSAEEMLARRLAEIRKVGTPLRKVIAVLSPDQLRLLDRSMPLMMP